MARKPPIKHVDYVEISSFESAAAMVAVAALSAITLAIMQIHPENLLSDVCDYLIVVVNRLDGRTKQNGQ